MIGKFDAEGNPEETRNGTGPRANPALLVFRYARPPFGPDPQCVQYSRELCVVRKARLEKGWDWGDPPCFGGVCSGECEIFLCENAQGGRGKSDVKMTFGPEGYEEGPE